MPQENSEHEGVSPHVDEVPSFGDELVEEPVHEMPDESVDIDASNQDHAVVDIEPDTNLDADVDENEGVDTDAPEAPKRKRSRGGFGNSWAAKALGLGSGESSKASSDDAEAQGDTRAPAGDAGVSDETAAPTTGRRQRPKKPHEKLDSVLPDNVPGPAISLISQCTAFEYTPEKFATLLLDTDDIGGLSKKLANDADKGTIIQAMTNNKISIFTMGEMLANDMLVIIPNDSTIQMMEEFNLLVKAPYTWCIVDTSSKSEFVAESVAPATFEQCREIALGTMNVTEVIDAAIAKLDADAENAPVGRHLAPENTATEAAPAVVASGSTRVEETPVAEEPVVSEDADDEDEWDGPPEDAYGPSDDEFGSPDGGQGHDDEEVEDMIPVPVVDADQSHDEGAYDDREDGGDEDYVGHQYDDETDEQDDDPHGDLDDEVVGEEEVQDAILRRFRDTRLDFDVTTEDFENIVQSFDRSTPFLPTETDSREDVGGSWLADIIAAQTDAANGEISALHEANIDAAREMYVKLMSKGIIQIAEKTSLDDPNTLYGDLKVVADGDYTDALARLDLLVQEERARLSLDFDRGLEAAAVAAAESAKVKYREENQARLDRESHAAASRLTTMLEEVHESRIASIAEDRRQAARANLDVLSHQSIAALTPLLEQQRDEELTLAKDWSARIVKVVDENLKADLARTETVQADLDRTDRIARLTSEHQNELATKSNEYQRELADVNVRLVEAETRAQSALDGLRASLQARIDEAEGNARAAQDRIQALESDRDTLTERLEERHATQLRAEKDAHAADILSFNQRWASAVMVRRLLYIVAFALIALVGVAAYVLGLHNGHSGFIQVDDVVTSLYLAL